MKKDWLVFACVGILGCNAIAGIFEGAPRGLDFCLHKPAGTPLPEQTPGDCKVTICDAEGNAKTVAAPNDKDDKNPCTADRCSGLDAIHAPTIPAVSCYSGSPATLGVGLCKAGTQQCHDGTPSGPCEGEVLPAPEQCSAALEDEDCDGLLEEEGEGCGCGDSILQPDLLEECDDGNDDDSDMCTSACKRAFCGDGFVNAGEEACDDENLDSTDGCTTSCTLPVCGDGLAQWGESCDDGNTKDGDGCPGNCRAHAVKLAAGARHTCALFEDGRVKCWGDNAFGQLGVGDTKTRGDEPNEMGHALPIVDLGAQKRAKSLVAGEKHSCALLESGGVKCWGFGGHGALGLGDPHHRGDEPGEMGDKLPEVDLGTDGSGKSNIALALAAGALHTCALLAGGAVKCWGSGVAGQLGIGAPDNRGDVMDEMGDALPAVDLGPGESAVGITAGRYHTCATLAGGAIKCWGVNFYGQLGLGDTLSRGAKPGQMGGALPSVDLGLDAQAAAVFAGGGFTCALRVDGALKCWGVNSQGQLGIGSADNRVDMIDEMGALLPPIDLGLGGPKIATIAAGGNHTCALIVSGHLKCWGANGSGQLGLGDTSDRGSDLTQMGKSLPIVDLGPDAEVASIVAGNAHACALLTDGTIKCWGDSFSGQLGLGDIKLPGASPDTMGSALPRVEVW